VYTSKIRMRQNTIMTTWQVEACRGLSWAHGKSNLSLMIGLLLYFIERQTLKHS